LGQGQGQERTHATTRFLAEGVPIAMEELKEAAGIDCSVPLRTDLHNEQAEA